LFETQTRGGDVGCDHKAPFPFTECAVIVGDELAERVDWTVEADDVEAVAAQEERAWLAVLVLPQQFMLEQRMQCGQAAVRIH
jgi:hypothetical protein